MPEETKPAKPTLKSTNTRIDAVEIRINDEVIATRQYCRDSISEYNDMLAILIGRKEYTIYTMLIWIFSSLAIITSLQLFEAMTSVFTSTTDCFLVGAKLVIYVWASYMCYAYGKLGEHND